ncbi:MAG TPA: alpha/beta hydrolase-fold protein, partial [Burkholderiales bacterium]|nr:alpha/beta hydrolase-fold protein [Burkholderiales bacterium]
MKPLICAILSCSIWVWDAARAEVIDGTFNSPALGVSKTYRVYLPTDYSSSDYRYPVIYLLHGWGVTERYWIDQLALAETADAIRLQAIIVMPDGDRSFYSNSLAEIDYETCLSESAPRQNKEEPRKEFCVRKANYETYIVADLIDHIDREFRTHARRGGRGISGESAGGFGAMQLAMRNKDVFGSVAVHSAFLSLLYDGPRPYTPGVVKNRSFIEPEKMNPAAVEVFGRDIARWRAHDPVSLVETLAPDELRIYFDCGMQDEYGFYDEARYFDEQLKLRAIPHRFEAVEGKHEDALWKERIKHSLLFHAQSFREAGFLPQ